MNQKIVYVNREDDVIIVQNEGPEEVYQDTLENFATDSGTAVPATIQSMDRCWDTGLAMLNGVNGLTEEAEAWASALVETASALCSTQNARKNPPEPEPPAPTEEELQLQALRETQGDAQSYLYSTDYRIIKFMDKYIEEHPDVLAEFAAEYPDTLAQRQTARDTINSTQMQIDALVASMSETSEEA